MGPQIMEIVEGTHRPSSDGTVSLDMSVIMNYPKGSVERGITGTLEKRLCLVGVIHYWDRIAQTGYDGDMILVDYESHLGPNIQTRCR